MNYNQRILDGLTKVFPNHHFEWSEPTCGASDFVPRQLLMVDGSETKILFNPELVEDLFVTLNGNGDPFDMKNLMIPLIPEKMEPIFEELLAMFIAEVKEHLEVLQRERGCG